MSLLFSIFGVWKHSNFDIKKRGKNGTYEKLENQLELISLVIKFHYCDFCYSVLKTAPILRDSRGKSVQCYSSENKDRKYHKPPVYPEVMFQNKHEVLKSTSY